MNQYFAPIAIISIIIATAFLIKQIPKIKQIKKENTETIIMLLAICLSLLMIFAFENTISNSSIEIWKGNEIKLLSTNKSLNVALQPLYNYGMIIFRKAEMFEFLNIFTVTLFYMIFFKLIEVFKSNRILVLTTMVFLIPLTHLYFINSVEDSFFAIGIILFLAGLKLDRKEWSITGLLISILFKEWLAVSIILFAVIDLINESFFKIRFELVYSVFLISFIFFIASIYSFTDLIRYTFAFIAFFILISFKGMKIQNESIFQKNH